MHCGLGRLGKLGGFHQGRGQRATAKSALGDSWGKLRGSRGNRCAQPSEADGTQGLVPQLMGNFYPGSSTVNQ